MTDRLEIKQLTARIGGRTALSIDALTAPAGEVLVILGDAGSGKTVLAAAMAGSIVADGSVLVDGVTISGTPSQRRRRGLSVAVRDGERLAGCTVVEALRLSARRPERVRAALERFPQLATRRSVLAQLLSGGEQQLLRVACAWTAAPRVLVLDSPTVGLAADAQAAVTVLATAEAAAGATVVWLEQDRRAAPAPPRMNLVRGRVVPA